jgi:hypothetical protein
MDAESFQRHVGVVCVISWSGLFQAVEAGRAAVVGLAMGGSYLL